MTETLVPGTARGVIVGGCLSLLAADVGSANFERYAEMSLANNAREMLDQSQLALRHIELGVYGRCDNCGQPIGKGRLQAFPRATLCVTCKQREERR